MISTTVALMEREKTLEISLKLIIGHIKNQFRLIWKSIGISFNEA